MTPGDDLAAAPDARRLPWSAGKNDNQACARRRNIGPIGYNVQRECAALVSDSAGGKRSTCAFATSGRPQRARHAGNCHTKTTFCSPASAASRRTFRANAHHLLVNEYSDVDEHASSAATGGAGTDGGP